MSAAASARDRGVEVLLVGSVWESEVLVSLLWEASFIRAVTRELAQEPKVQTALGRPLIHMETRHLHQQPLLVLCKLENVLAVLEGRLGPLLPAQWLPYGRCASPAQSVPAPQGAAVTQMLG